MVGARHAAHHKLAEDQVSAPLIKPVRAYENYWLTDSSRISAGHRCRMSRYLGYSAGPHGTGLTRRSMSTPLVTGVAVHAALQTILEECQRNGSKEIPSDEFIQLATSVQVEKYKAQVKARGLDVAVGADHAQGSGGDRGDSEAANRVREQTTLLAALVFGYCRITLPVLLEEFEILKVEQEEDLDLGSRTLLMSRRDLLLRDRTTGEAVMWDFKSSSTINDSYVEQWKSSPQMMVGARAASYLLGEPVKRFYIDVLMKGSMKPDYNEATGAYDGPRRQQSFLVWPYFKPGSPPLVPDEWQPFWKYACGDAANCSKNRSGQPHNHTLGKGWERKLHPDPWKWVQSLRKGDLATAYQILGPYPIDDYKIDQYLRGQEQDEEDWIRRVGAANAAEDTYSSVAQAGWETQEFQEELDRLFPRSYQCENVYGAPCQFKALCFKTDPGWRDPIGSGLYIPRAPHHAQEEAAFKALGVPLTNELGEEIEE